MQLGLVSQIFTQMPGTTSPWEPEAGIEEAARIAVAAEELGYDFITCSEHVAIPTEVGKVRGFTYWDPLPTFGYLTAVTSRIRFATFVLVLGYHHPLEIVKRYGTLDRVCGGRLILGLGIGSLKEEFELLGAEFDDRGPRADEAIRALKASFGTAVPEFHGRYYDYEGFMMNPCSIQSDVPFWIGGRTYRSLRRSVELGDAWAPFNLTMREMDAMIARARQTDEWAARTKPLDIVVQSPILDPIGDPETTKRKIERMQAMGATAVGARVANDTIEEAVDQTAALRELWPA